MLPDHIIDGPVDLACKPNAADVVDRLGPFYERRARDQIFATLAVPSATLDEFARRHAASECDYPDPFERAGFWDALCSERVALEDDSMPAAYLSEFDQGLYGGLLGGDVHFLQHPENGWISSMVPPLLTDWTQFDSLAFDESHPWWEGYLTQMRVFAERGAGRWGMSHFILIDGLNFVFELVGGLETFLSVEREPEYVRRAIDFGFELNLKVQQAFFAGAGTIGGGTLSNFGQWIPGRIVSESLDPFHMTSVDYFERWGREPAERIMRRFDGGVIHIHGNGRHLLRAASTLEGLRAILLLDDVGIPPAFDVLADLQAQTGDVPLSCYVPYARFAEQLDARTLPGGVLYNVTGVPDVPTANRCMDKVRTYRV